MPKSKKIAIICSMDGYANTHVPIEIGKYLKNNGHEVTFVNTIFLRTILLQEIKSLNIYFLLAILTVLNAITLLQMKYLPWTKKLVFYYVMLGQMKIRGLLLKQYFDRKSFDLIICETTIDSYVFLHKLKNKTLYHCPTPWADELYYGNEITESQYKRFLKLEKKIYRSVDYLAFHWQTYKEYIKKYLYEGDNVITLNIGCTLKQRKATFSDNPKIVYVGFLGGYWIDLDLLSRLNKIYPYIDVYGSPRPDSKYGLNYLGYLSDLAILTTYQFGLITISKDKLRKHGFSAKHLEYISWGLPVLTPSWRKDNTLDSVSIHYDENNFLDVIKYYSKKNHWTSINRNSINKARELEWNNVLKPLALII